MGNGGERCKTRPSASPHTGEEGDARRTGEAPVAAEGGINALLGGSTLNEQGLAHGKHLSCAGCHGDLPWH